MRKSRLSSSQSSKCVVCGKKTANYAVFSLRSIDITIAVCDEHEDQVRDHKNDTIIANLLSVIEAVAKE